MHSFILISIILYLYLAGVAATITMVMLSISSSSNSVTLRNDLPSIIVRIVATLLWFVTVPMILVFATLSYFLDREK